MDDNTPNNKVPVTPGHQPQPPTTQPRRTQPVSDIQARPGQQPSVAPRPASAAQASNMRSQGRATVPAEGLHEGHQAGVSQQPIIMKKSTNRKRNMMIALILLLVLSLGIGGGVWALIRNKDDNKTTNTSTTSTNSNNTSSTGSTTTTTNTTNSGGTTQATATETGRFASTYALAGTTDCPELANFIDVSKFEGPGAGYANPTLSVACTDTTLTIKSNGMPSYAYVATTPNALTAQNFEFSLPRNPSVATVATAIHKTGTGVTLGTLGFAVNGAAWFGPTEGAQPADQAYGDPIANNLMDACLGHTASAYHYHAFKQTCFYPDYTETSASPVLGYALDGFPIYGSIGCDDLTCTKKTTYKSGYVMNADGNPTKAVWDAYTYKSGQGAEYLDECNGRVGPDGTYRYHATEKFPYIIGCFKGTPNLSNTQPGRS